MAGDLLMRAVPFDDLAVGDEVLVTTKMGREVDRGVVTEIFVTGAVAIRCMPRDADEARGAVCDRIFDPKLYNFVLRDENDLARPELVSEAENGEEPEDEEKEEPKKEKAPPKKAAPKEDTGVDPANLPEQIRKKLVGVDGLDEEAKNRVISMISDAALRSLKNVGVKDSDVYKKVVDIQEAVLKVLK